jgi:hypothetical protein
MGIIYFDNEWSLPFPVWSIDSASKTCLVLAYLCNYRLFDAAVMYINARSGPVALHDWIIAHPSKRFPLIPCAVDPKGLLDGIECWRKQKAMTVMHIAAMLSSPDFLQLFIYHGASVNTISPAGLCVLGCAMGPLAWDRSGSLRSVEILIAAGATVNPSGVSMTPLQLAVLDRTNAQISNLRDDYQVIALLLHYGANPNRVGDDATNILRIRETSDLCEPDAMEDSNLAIAMQRGNSEFYDTPLRILIKEKREAAAKGCDLGVDAFIQIETLLKAYGAKDLHLFPHQNLPGYVPEDMEQWRLPSRE